MMSISVGRNAQVPKVRNRGWVQWTEICLFEEIGEVFQNGREDGWQRGRT
jgi:hypothetical protein